MSRSGALLAAVLLGALALGLLADETRLLTGSEPWRVEGHFAPGGIYPISDGSALARSGALGTSPRLWGSWLGNDAHTGTLRSPSFVAPPQLALFVTGYPNAAGNGLFVERASDGARHSLGASSPGLQWRDERFALPRDFRGQRVRLIAIDGSALPSGWLGLSTPRAITRAAWMLRWSEETSPVPLAVALFGIGLAWLLRSLLPFAPRRVEEPQREAITGAAGTTARLFAALCLGLVFLLHLGVLHRYAVDIPYLDEWWHLSSLPNALAREWSGSWIWQRHGDQRIVFTKLHTWWLLGTGGWNLRSQILQNFLLYGGLLCAAFALLRRSAPHLDAAGLLAFLILLLSPIAHENHQHGVQSHLHFALLFIVLSASLAFRSPDRHSSALAAAALAVAAILASGAAAFSMLAVVAVFAAYLGLAEPNAAAGARLGRLAIVALPVGLAVAAGSGGYAAGPEQASPASAEFWLFYLNLVSGGFGVSSNSVLLGGFWLAVTLLPWVVRAARAGRAPNGPLSRGDWRVLALTVGVLSGLFATALARGGSGAEAAKASRYAELAALLLPLSAVAWSSALLPHPTARRRVLAGLFALAAFASLDDWSTQPYRLQRVARQGGLECARDYYERGSLGVCPTVADRPIGRELDRARELELRFFERVQPGTSD